MNELILFEDVAGSIKFDIANFVKVEVGQSKSIEAYLINTSDRFHIINIKEAHTDEDVIIANVPNQLSPKEVKSITITFKPSLNRDEGLHSDSFFTGELIKP